MNADSLLGKTGALLSHNIFAYCENSPNRLADSNGQVPDSAYRKFGEGLSIPSVLSPAARDAYIKREFHKRFGSNIPRTDPLIPQLVARTWIVETAAPAGRSVPDKILSSFTAIGMNLKQEGSFGAGLGVGAGLAGVNLEVEMHLDAIQAQIYSKPLPELQNSLLPPGLNLGCGAGFSAGATIAGFGPSVSASWSASAAHPSGVSEFGGLRDEMTLLGVDAYIGIGGRYELSLNTRGLANDWIEIWK